MGCVRRVLAGNGVNHYWESQAAKLSPNARRLSAVVALVARMPFVPRQATLLLVTGGYGSKRR